MAIHSGDHALVGAYFALPLWQRPRALHRLIRELDHLDLAGEDMEEDDHSGDPLDIDGESPTDDDTPMLVAAPLYGVDQSSGPTNWQSAYHAWQLKLLEAAR